MRAEPLARGLLLVGVLLAPAAIAAPTAQPPTSQPSAPRYNLRQLVAMARTTYPGVQAAREAIRVLERDVFRARWAWVPNLNVVGLIAPAPELRCFTTDASGKEVPSTTDCTHTKMSTSNVAVANSYRIAGILAKIDVQLGMPLFTFGKIKAAREAAKAGVAARQAQLRSAEDRLEVDVTRAYWGLKLAREILYTLREGRGYIVDAEKNIEKDIDEDAGEYTLTDLLRIKTARSEIDGRLPDAEKLEKLTMVALRTLTGQTDQPFGVDTNLLEVLGGEPLAVSSYVSIAATERPDLKALEAAVRARHAVVDLERARFFPDFLFVAMVSSAYASSIDMPQNAFYNNPFNYPIGGGFGLAMSWRIDPLQFTSFLKSKSEALETKARQAEATLGVQLEIQNAHASLVEARKRLGASRSGEKAARRWLVATSQNLAAGLAETRDLTDSLLGYFTQRLRYLQAIYDVNLGWSELGRVIGAYPQRK